LGCSTDVSIGVQRKLPQRIGAVILEADKAPCIPPPSPVSPAPSHKKVNYSAQYSDNPVSKSTFRTAG
jgi:hypothetical protein